MNIFTVIGFGIIVFLSYELNQIGNTLEAYESIKNSAEGNLHSLAKRHKSEIEKMKKDYENEVTGLNKELQNVATERDVLQNRLSQYLNASARMYQN